jgi:RNA polymerase sigma-70 factor (ECF subfamily)
MFRLFYDEREPLGPSGVKPGVEAARASPADAHPREVDDTTLRRAQRGEDAAFTRLVQIYERPVFALLGRMLGPGGRRDRVEDLAQETFLRVFRALPGFRPAGPARLSTWILTIATRLALDELRRLRPARSLEDAAAVVAPDDAAAPAERARMRAALARAVAGLSDEQRAVFLLREVHELEYQEIAEALEVDLGTVKSRLSRARAALRAALSEEEP